MTTITVSGKAVLAKIPLNEGVGFFRAHHESAMLAVTLEDFSIIIVDIETRNIVRKFLGHTAQLTDATFSPDSRWLITSAMDCTIRVWDIPSSQLIDCFQVNIEGCRSHSFLHIVQLCIYPLCCSFFFLKGGFCLHICELFTNW